jgi:aminopeptidase C
MVKNSWGTDNPYKGTWYASVPFVEYKTISIVVNKNVLSKELRKKLGI